MYYAEKTLSAVGKTETHSDAGESRCGVSDSRCPTFICLCRNT